MDEQRVRVVGAECPAAGQQQLTQFGLHLGIGRLPVLVPGHGEVVAGDQGLRVIRTQLRRLLGQQVRALPDRLLATAAYHHQLAEQAVSDQCVRVVGTEYVATGLPYLPQLGHRLGLGRLIALVSGGHEVVVGDQGLGVVRAQQDRLFGEDVRALAHLFRVARELGADEETIKAAWSGGLSATDLVWRELDAAEHPWLLVLDNADEPAWLAAETGVPGDGTGWLRSSRAGLTVVTSRVGSPGVWGHEADTHRIGVLSPADGRDVLLDLAGEAGDPAEAQVLAERLDGLPLALKLAGSYLARSARGAGLLRHRGPRSGGRLRSFATYTEALGEAGAGFLDQGEHRRLDEAGTERMHRSLVGRTWELSLDLLEEQRLPEARFLMRLLSCCAPAPFPVELLDSETLPSAAEPDQADRALEALIDLSLVDVVDIAPDGEGAPVPCLVSHRLVLEANALRLADSAAGERRVIWRAIARILEGVPRSSRSSRPTGPGGGCWARTSPPPSPRPRIRPRIRRRTRRCCCPCCAPDSPRSPSTSSRARTRPVSWPGCWPCAAPRSPRTTRCGCPSATAWPSPRSTRPRASR